MGEVTKTQLAVIGGGPGGYAAAFMAADLGLEVTLIDLEPNPGGVCLYRGCIPSKALLHCAKILNEAQEAGQWGITFAEPDIDLGKMRKRKEAVVQKLTGGLGQLCKSRKITFVQGRASFTDSDRLRITKGLGEESELQFEHAILATGSRPASLPDLYFDSPRIMNSSSALDIEEIPKKLLVVGAGYIGLELGSVYAALGSEVTVVEMSPAVLPGADPDLARVLGDAMQKKMHQILLNTRVAEVKEKGDGIHVKFEGENIEQIDQVFDRTLVCIGRVPNSSGLGLKSTKIEVNDRGFVQVDEQRRTSDPKIFAIGDIVGEPMLAHKASHEGRVAAEVIAGQQSVFAPLAIPAVVFTDPEVAWCGLTEMQAEKDGKEIKVGRFPWGASGRAATMGRSDGLTKIIADPDTDRVLGVGIAGPGAGELIAEGTLAIEMGALASDIELTIHAHPTLGETVMETAEMIFGRSTHFQASGNKKS